MTDENPESIKIELRYIRRDLDDIKNKLDDHYVTSEEFAPIKNIVYGLVGLILSSVVVGILALVLR